MVTGILLDCDLKKWIGGMPIVNIHNKFLITKMVGTSKSDYSKG